MRTRSLLLLLAVLAAPSPIVAQRSSPAPAEAHERARRGPVEMLLRQRDRLALTPEQVGRLESIRDRMDERNRPLVARLLEMRKQIRTEFDRRPEEMTKAERERFRARASEARPLMREIRDNNRTAMREVGEILTAQQKEQVRDMVREHRKRNDGHRSRRGRGPGS